MALFSTLTPAQTADTWEDIEIRLQEFGLTASEMENLKSAFGGEDAAAVEDLISGFDKLQELGIDGVSDLKKLSTIIEYNDATNSGALDWCDTQKHGRSQVHKTDETGIMVICTIRDRSESLFTRQIWISQDLLENYDDTDMWWDKRPLADKTGVSDLLLYIPTETTQRLVTCADARAALDNPARVPINSSPPGLTTAGIEPQNGISWHFRHQWVAFVLNSLPAAAAIGRSARQADQDGEDTKSQRGGGDDHPADGQQHPGLPLGHLCLHSGESGIDA